MCPSNLRATGVRNPAYTGTYVFENDYPALLPEAPESQNNEAEVADLLVARAERGACRVMCFSPRHDLTIATMASSALLQVVGTWVEQYRELGALPYINHVQIFENRGAAMGASNPHPHCQIWATESIPNEPAKEQASLRAYLAANGTCLLCRYLAAEITCGDRKVLESEYFIVVVPFWAVWPFEVMVLANRHVTALDELTEKERLDLAVTLKRLTAGFDRLFGVAFPYSMGFHQRPTDGQAHPEWHFHGHFYPPLLRSATVRKFMVGFELLGTPQRDITPESAAARLREHVET
jgi:UDPglucose--hexose-1-phosphate uridylyltransferase